MIVHNFKKGIIRDTVNFVNKITLCDYVKCEIRNQITKFLSKKAKKKIKKHEPKIFYKLNILEQNMQNKNSEEYLNYLRSMCSYN